MENFNKDVKICLIDPDNFNKGWLPKYMTKGSSAMDLYSIEDKILLPQEIYKFKTGFALELPVGHEAQIRPRSGLASKGIYQLYGTIDNDYRGEVGIILSNLGINDYRVKKGQRIAQMAIKKVEQFNLKLVSSLSETKRGSGGFGSTGV